MCRYPLSGWGRVRREPRGTLLLRLVYFHALVCIFPLSLLPLLNLTYSAGNALQRALATEPSGRLQIIVFIAFFFFHKQHHTIVLPILLEEKCVLFFLSLLVFIKKRACGDMMFNFFFRGIIFVSCCGVIDGFPGSVNADRRTQPGGRKH